MLVDVIGLIVNCGVCCELAVDVVDVCGCVLGWC